MPACDVWDLVKVPFPYTHRPVQQRRPALVVAIPDVPGGPALLWVLMVTSAVNRGWRGDVLVSDPGAAGLPAPSVIRSAKITTIEQQNAERIGCLPEEDQSKVAAALQETFAQLLRG